MKDKIFGVLQRVGRSFMLPIALLPVAGLLLGIGGSLSNQTMIAAYGLAGIMGEGTIPFYIFKIMSDAGDIIFANLPLLFAMGVAIGMAKKEKAVAALSGVIAYFIMHTVIGSLISLTGTYDPATLAAANEALQAASLMDGTKYVAIEAARMLPSGSITTTVGITSLQMGVFGGIIVGLGVAALHNKFYNIELPPVISFFGGTRFVPIISALTFVIVGAVMFFVWPFVQVGINILGQVVIASGYIGTFFYGYIERALIPFGLHHVFYLPFWQTAVGGTMTIDGNLVEGAQNIFFAQLGTPNIDHFAVSATRFMSGKFPFMIFGLPAAALAMIHCAKPEKKEEAKGLLLSAGLTSMITGITEPIEFTFLFVAPALYYGIHSVLAGLSYMLMQILNVGVGMTFSGGLIDMFLFGILQGNAKTSWLNILWVGAIYAVIYYVVFKFVIIKFNLKTPGREDDDVETKLYTRADYNAKKAGEAGAVSPDGSDIKGDPLSIMITQGLGGKDNISDVDCCATRLRCTVIDAKKVNQPLLKQSGAAGIVEKGNGIQVIYGPRVTVIKSNLEEFLESPEADKVTAVIAPQENDEQAIEIAEEKTETKKGLHEVFTMPVDGRIAPISETPDDVFAEKMLGDGIVIFPTSSDIYAPCDGTVTVFFPTKHAIGISSEDGTEILIHVGIDTVKLEGKGFTAHVEQGDKIKRGDKILTVDLDFIKKNAPSTAIPIVFTDLPATKEMVVLKSGEAVTGDDVIEINS